MSGFDWSSVGLDKIDTSADYEYVAGEGLTYVMNFTNDGEVLVKKNGVIDAEIDAKDQNNISNGKIKFNYNVGVETDIILTMNGDNVDAELLALDMTVTYVKKTGAGTEVPPVVDLTKDRVYEGNGYYHVMTPDNQYKVVSNKQIILEYPKYEEHDGNIESFLAKYTQYQNYTIPDEVNQFTKFVVVYNNINDDITKARIFGAFDNENGYYKFYFVTDSGGGTSDYKISVDVEMEIDQNLTLEDLLQ